MVANLIRTVRTFFPRYALHKAKFPFKYSDWRVAGGSVNASYSYQSFQDILKNGTTLNSGFVLEFSMSGFMMLMSI